MADNTGKRRQVMKKMPSVDDLQTIIETAKLAVDGSDFGPLFIYPDASNVKNKQCNQLAWALFSLMVTSMMARVEFEGNVTKKEADSGE